MRRMQPSLSLSLSAKARPPPSKFKHATPSLRVLPHTQRIAEGAYTRDPAAGQRALRMTLRAWKGSWMHKECGQPSGRCVGDLIRCEYMQGLSDPCNHRRARSRRAPLHTRSVATASTSLESPFQITRFDPIHTPNFTLSNPLPFPFFFSFPKHHFLSLEQEEEEYT